MEKLRFTQLFRESEKELSDDEKGDIIIMSFPKDEQDAIDAEYTEAKANHQLDSFFDKYKDILEASSGSDVETDTTETVTDNEEPSETETTTESEEASENVEGEDEDDANANTEEAENKDENDEGITDKDFVNIIDTAMTVKLDDATEKDNEAFYRAMGVTAENKKHFEEYEEYFGFGLNGKPKESVKIMFKTPFHWTYKMGDVVKKDDPLFKTVAYMNEFVLWRRAAEVFMENKTIRACDEPIFKAMENHIAGTELNNYIKKETDKLAKVAEGDEEKLSVIGKSIAASKSGTTPISDIATGEKINQNNDIILFIYKKVYPSIIKMAKKGSIGKNPPANRRCVLGNDLAGTQLYKNLYLKAIGNVDLIDKPDEMLDEIIRDGYTTLLGGRAVVRATRDSISERPRYKAIFDTPQAGPVSIFDSNWIGNGVAKSMLVNYERAWDFVQDGNDSFSVTTARKMTGKKGKTQGVGVPAKSYAMAVQGLSDEVVKAKFDLGEIDKIQYEGFQLAKKLVFGMISDLEPFSVIASQVATDFGNYLQTLTRIGSHMLGVYNIYGKKYYSKEEIEKANPQDREKMLRINKEWEKATENLKVPVSLDTTVPGKDGDTGTSFGDTIADKVHGISAGDKDIVQKNMVALVNHLKAVKTFVDNLPESNIKEIGEKINGYYSIICQSRFEYIGLREPRITAKGALNMVVGKQPGSGKNLGQLVDLIPIQKMDNWGLHTDGSGASPIGGMGGNFNPNEDSLSFNHGAFNCYSKVRSLPGLYYINYTDDGVEDFKVYVSSLERLYNYSRSKIFELLEKGGLNIDDKGYGKGGDSRIISGQLYAPNEIKDNGKIIERIPVSLTSMDVPYTDINDYLVDNSYCQWRIASRAKAMSPAQLKSFRNDPATEDFRKELKKRHDFDVDKAIDTMDKKGKYDKGLNPQGVQLTANPDGGLVFTNSDSNLGTPEIHDNFGMDFVKGNKVRYNQEVNTDNFKVTGGHNKADESMFEFFGEVFREASAKETPKKQRFTIN